MSENPLRDEAERRGQQDSLVFAAVTLLPGGSATAAKVTQAPFVLERLTFDIFEIVERRMMVPHAETFEVIVPRKERASAGPGRPNGDAVGDACRELPPCAARAACEQSPCDADHGGMQERVRGSRARADRVGAGDGRRVQGGGRLDDSA